MAEYIDREAFKRKLIDEKNFFPAIVARALHEMPTADVVEVVRCKDCKHHRDLDGGVQCERMDGLLMVLPNDFCSYGERKEK